MKSEMLSKFKVMNKYAAEALTLVAFKAIQDTLDMKPRPRVKTGDMRRSAFVKSHTGMERKPEEGGSPLLKEPDVPLGSVMLGYAVDYAAKQNILKNTELKNKPHWEKPEKDKPLTKNTDEDADAGFFTPKLLMKSNQKRYQKIFDREFVRAMNL